MSEVAPLISDLATILIIAGIITVIFKWLGQPVIVGYIVAGIMAGPSISLFPTVSDQANIKIWADIGVIFLLFAIGLDFSFRKLISVGASAIFSTVIIVCGMMFLGYTAGNAMGFSHTSCIFLGGMLSMSSTAIVFKAFSDMGLLDQKFTGIVLGILIIEDVVAVIMMVVLSTLAVGKHFEGFEMLESILKLAAFLIFWSALGIYLIPTLLKRLNRFISNEILLTTSLGLCLGMVIFLGLAGKIVVLVPGLGLPGERDPQIGFRLAALQFHVSDSFQILQLSLFSSGLYSCRPSCPAQRGQCPVNIRVWPVTTQPRAAARRSSLSS